TSATTGSSGGADGGTSDCTSSTLVPGTKPIPPSKFAQYVRNDHVTGGEGTAGGLENNKKYACAVASFDLLGNAGPLSKLACETPYPVDDFWKLYRKDGGQAGGGFCSIGGTDSGHFAFGGGLAGLMGVLLVRRRRRSERGPR